MRFTGRIAASQRWVDPRAKKLQPLIRRAVGTIAAVPAAVTGADTSTHPGGLLHEGSREGDSVVCPWHDSRFDHCSVAERLFHTQA